MTNTNKTPTGNDSFRFLLSKTIECPTNHPLLTSWVLDNGNCSKCGKTDTYVTAADKNGEIEKRKMLAVQFLCDRCLNGEYFPVRF